jgi:pyridine nucleotide-disulfide oxidoreductase family protein
MRTRSTRLVLVGGGHSHIEVLRRFALQREAEVELTLISPSPLAAYAGMLPGVVAGHYAREEAQVDLEVLAQRAGARYVCDEVAGIDLYTKTLALADDDVVPFDLLSLDVGSTPDHSLVPGAREHASPVRPAAAFLSTWERMQADAANGSVSTIAIVGGGASGVELLLAMQHHLHRDLGDAAPRFALITDQPQLLPEHAPAVRARFGQLLVNRGVVLHLNSGAIAVEAGAVIATHHRRIAVDRILWATSAAAPPWLARAGLACDAHGFVQVDDTLRSKSHPYVFASGDCATQVAHPRPKSSVFAVRQGPPLASNLRRALRHEALLPHVPQRRVLALIATGDRHAIAAHGPFMLEGEWVWRWKDRVDRAFMAKYAVPTDMTQPARAAGEE